MRRLAPALLAALLLAGCRGQQAMLDAAGDQAAHTVTIWNTMLAVCGVMYALVLAFLGWSLWRARRKLAGEPLAESFESPADRPMRHALTGWSVLIIAGLFTLAGASFLVDRSLAMAETRNAVKIKVTGAQWWWKVEYDDPIAAQRITTANELHLPAGRPAVVQMAAQDVIHSFWIPNLAGKIDLIPGRNNQIVLNPRRPGLYRGQCAEFCGLEHALMALDATVETPEGFAAWQAAQRRPAPEPATDQQRRGRDVFMTSACASCHQIQGTDAGGQTGPNLTHFAARRSLAAASMPKDHKDLIAWLHDTQKMKPGAHMPNVGLSDADREALVAYLASLT